MALYVRVIYSSSVLFFPLVFCLNSSCHLAPLRGLFVLLLQLCCVRSIFLTSYFIVCTLFVFLVLICAFLVLLFVCCVCVLSSLLSCLCHLGGLVVKASASRVEGPGFESSLRLDFSGSSHTSDLKIGTPLATLPGAWRYRVSAGTGRPGVSIL